MMRLYIYARLLVFGLVELMVIIKCTEGKMCHSGMSAARLGKQALHMQRCLVKEADKVLGGSLF